MAEFMFATGIECSCPMIENGKWRMDELDATLHYRYWRRDLELVKELGLRYLRYGPPIHKIFVAPGKYDWSFFDDVADYMKQLNIVPIVDLCHFGLPDWLENFQNPDFPNFFGEYAREFAKRYSWMKFYTPINEMYVTARMSTLDGIWNEQIRTERAFVTGTRHIVKACTLAMEAILSQRQDAVFINSESSEFFQACCPYERIRKIADFENQRRFIALDLLYCVPVRPDILDFLIREGMPRQEYEWFMNNRVADRAILGLDYYVTNEKVVDSQGNIASLGELFGWYVITQQYYRRYKRPVMHTETNSPDALDAAGWLWRQWHNVQLIRADGVPVIGFTWYSLQDQVDWDVGLSRSVGNVNPVGLYDLNRDPRTVAIAYKHLIAMYRNEVKVEEKEVLELLADRAA